MNLDYLELLLRAWGRAYGDMRGVVIEEERDAPDTHPLARAAAAAPGERVSIIRQRTTMDRGGQDRRRHMATNAGGVEAVGLRLVPAGFVDCIPCPESRAGGRSVAADWPVPPEVQRVHVAAEAVRKADPVRGACLRAHYWTRGTLEERAEHAAKLAAQAIKVRLYRDAVREARFAVLVRLTVDA